MKTKRPDRLRKILPRGIIFAILLISCLGGTQNVKGLGILPVDDVGNGILQFKSGFEGSTHITGNTNTTGGVDNWIEGVDGPLGDWSSLKNGTNSTLAWNKYAYAYLNGGHMAIVPDPTNPNNHVLRFMNDGGGNRSQWQLTQVKDYWTDDGRPNQFTQQFYRYRMYIPSDIKKVPSYNSHAPWYMIWESHTWPQFSGGEKTRHGIYLQKNQNSNLWYFNAIQERPEGCHYYEGPGPSCVVYWDNHEHQNIPVPFDQWFTFEVFFRYSETDGEWYVAITRDRQPRQEIAHFVGRTKFDEKLHDQMIMKMYHDTGYISVLGETRQYYDDLEIWSDYPPGYFDNSSTVTPTITIIPLTSTNTPTNTVPTLTLAPLLAPLPGLSWEAEQGEITTPFVVANGVVSQDTLTTNPIDGGQALYRFTIQDAGDYIVKATVNAADSGSNSFFVGMDSDPDTSMTWDIVLTNGFEERIVSWREGDAPDGNASIPKVFSLTQGAHNLIFRGREINTLLDKVEVTKVPVVQATITAPPGVTLTQTPIPVPPTLMPTNTPVQIMRSPTITALPTNVNSSSPLPGLVWEAEQGEITAPFTVTNGVISQSILSVDPTEGGRALYRFALQDAGDYIVKAIVNAADAGSNSFFVGMDGEPNASMIWDITLTNGFEEREVSWRDGAAPEANASITKVFSLAPGEHTLIIRGREIGTLLDKVEIVKVLVAQPTIPAQPTATASQISSATPTTEVAQDPAPQPTITPSYNATTVQLPTPTSTYTPVPTMVSNEPATQASTLEPPTSVPIKTSVPVMPTSTNTLVPPADPPTETSTPAIFTSTPVPPTATWTPLPVPASRTPTVTAELPPTGQPPSQPATETVYDDKDSAFAFSSNWQNINKRQAYKRSYKETTSNGSFVTLGFTGSSFSVLYKTGREYRTIDVYVDGVLVGSINERDWREAYQQRWNYPGQLTPGFHTLKLVFVTTNQKDRTKGSIDAVIVR
jgi:hypothetical protein